MSAGAGADGELVGSKPHATQCTFIFFIYSFQLVHFDASIGSKPHATQCTCTFSRGCIYRYRARRRDTKKKQKELCSQQCTCLFWGGVYIATTYIYTQKKICIYRYTTKKKGRYTGCLYSDLARRQDEIQLKKKKKLCSRQCTFILPRGCLCQTSRKRKKKKKKPPFFREGAGAKRRAKSHS